MTGTAVSNVSESARFCLELAATSLTCAVAIAGPSSCTNLHSGTASLLMTGETPVPRKLFIAQTTITDSPKHAFVNGTIWMIKEPLVC